jgi:hypothetical protein
MRFSFKNQRRTEKADSDIKSGDLISAMAHELTTDWYSSILFYSDALDPRPDLISIEPRHKTTFDISHKIRNVIL